MRRWSWTSGLVVLLALLGCSRSPKHSLPTLPAGGTVTFDGKPVEGAKVYFSPQTSGRAAYGVTDSQGRFQLSTSPNIPGALAGTYNVGISKERIEGGLTAEEVKAYYSKGKAPPGTRRPTKPINELPEKYKNPATSGLTATVKAGTPCYFTFDLKKDAQQQ